MKKTFLILLVGVSIGYWFGFKDSKVNEQNIAIRAINRVGGSSRDKVKSDIDGQMDSLEK
ncbi:MAG: hypothetical protein ABR543_05440 [Gemmatimonadaceae bacterium]